MPSNQAPAEPLSSELVFGLVAPVGVDLNIVTEVLTEKLQEVGYAAESASFRVTRLMAEVKVPLPFEAPGYIEQVRLRIAYANEMRKKLGDEALAALAVSAIRQFRRKTNLFRLKQRDPGYEIQPEDTPLEEVPLRNQAYIIRQLKRPEEVAILRQIYGKRFILISANAPLEIRRRYITEQERKSIGGLKPDVDIQCDAEALISQDSIEAKVEHGQMVRDAFPLGDVFIDVSTRQICEKNLRRFIRLFFGDNQLTPTRDEYGMYIAKSASLRSGDLSRQVGAATFTKHGEVLTLGCNEVPKAGGGTYWTDGAQDARDFALGYDPNARLTQEVLVDLLDRLKRSNNLAEMLAAQSPMEIAKKLLADKTTDGVRKSRVMDIIEFGRIIHAEMSAISDAARKGIALQDATLFCTAFPCHLCAKHIVAAGLSRVVYLEPYPKSYASLLHRDSIDTEKASDPSKVAFEAFIGVSPVRYRDLFEKSSRKKDGLAQQWQKEAPSPMIEMRYPAYFEPEIFNVAILKEKMVEVGWEAKEPDGEGTVAVVAEREA